MDSSQDLDKRVERSRRLLMETLLQLMSETAYSKISVANICERSGVARPTFYLHSEIVAPYLVQTTRRHFETQRGLDGPWPRLSPRTANRRIGRRRRGA